MYEVDILINNKFEYVYENEDLDKIDKILFQLAIRNLPARVLKDNVVLDFLDGSIYQYEYWHNRIMENENNRKR